MSSVLIATALYVGDKLLSQFIKEEGYSRWRKMLFPTQKYSERLRVVIQDSVEEYELSHPIVQNGKKFPFYHSQILFELLNDHMLFKKNNSNLIISEFEKNDNVIRPTDQDLEDFYKVFVRKVNTDKKLKKLFVDENYQAQIFEISQQLSVLVDLGNKVISKIENIDQTTKDVEVQMQRLNNKFERSFKFQNVLIPQGISIKDIGVQHGSNRDEYISEILNWFNSVNWIWLVGNVATGKSSVGVLASARFEERYWIDFDGIEANDMLSVIQLELSSHFKVMDLELGIVELVGKLTKGAILVLDNVPKLELRTQDWSRMRGFVKACIEADIKVLSISNYSLHEKISDYLNEGYILEKTISYLTVKEIDDILKFYNASEIISTSFSPLIHAISQGHPLIVKSICQYLKRVNWQDSDETLTQIFSGNYQNNLDWETYNKIIKTVENETEKRLLYRLQIVIGKITAKDVEVLAAIKPKIEFPFEKLNALSGTWLRRTSLNEYEISPLVKRLTESNLDPNLRDNLNRALGREILNQPIIDIISGRNAVLYFLQGKEYNQAGHLFSSMLQECIKQPDLYFKWHFYRMWRSTALPSQMDVFLRSFIRYLQISILKSYEDEDISFLVDDLEKIVLEAAAANVNVASSALLLATLLYKDVDRSTRFLVIGLSHRDRLQEVHEMISLPNELYSIESLIWKSLLSVETITDFDNWFRSFQSMTLEQRAASYIGDMSNICCQLFTKHLFESKITAASWEALVEILDHVLSRLDGMEIGILVECCLRYKIKYLIIAKDDVDGATKLVQDHLKLLVDEPKRFIVLDVLGRELFFKKNFAQAVVYLSEAASIEVSPLFTDKIETYLVLSQIRSRSDKHEAVVLARKAYEFQLNNEYVDDIFSAKVIGERAISEWEFEPNEKTFLLFEEAIEKVLDSYEAQDEYKGTLIRLCHSLNYFNFVSSKRDLPQIDGEPYVIPTRGIFALDNDALLNGGFYFEQRKFMANFLLVQVFEQLNDYNKAKKWAERCFNYKDDDTLNPFATLMSGMVAYIIREDRFEDAIQQELEQLRQLNETLNYSKASISLGSQTLEDMVKRIGSAPPPEANEDLYLLMFVVTFALIKGLNDFAISGNLDLIRSLSAKLSQLSKYFEDSYPIEIIRSALEKVMDSTVVGTTIAEMAVRDGEDKLANITNVYLISSVKCNSKVALQLHAAIIHRLHYFTKKLPSDGLYLFILVPFFINFWKSRIETKPEDFIEVDHLKTVGILSVEATDMTSRLSMLFKVLYYHLELNPPDDFFDSFALTVGN